MTLSSFVVWFFFGAGLGSAGNMLFFKIRDQEPILQRRIFCRHCARAVHPKDMIPVLSWLWLQGKCRHCRQAVSKQHLLLELLGGSIAAGLGWFVLS